MVKFQIFALFPVVPFYYPLMLFCCVLSVFTLTKLVLKALFCATIERGSFSLLNVVSSYPYEFSLRKISSVCHLKYPYSCFWSRLFVLFTHSRVLHTSVSWWFFPRVWVAVSLFKCPGLFLIIWPILTMLEFRWSPLVLLFQSLFQAFTDCSRCTNYHWYHRHLHFPYFFSSLPWPRYLYLFLLSFNFLL